MHRQIAGKLTGRVTKWIVLVFWILAVGVLGSFAGKLTEVQNNEASSWLPGNAESTQALEKMEPFQDPNAIPTTVVYEKESGFTPADLADDEGAGGRAPGRWTTSRARSSARSRPKDGQAAQTTVTYNLGADGLEPDARHRRQDPRHRRARRCRRLHRRRRRPGGRLRGVVRGPRRQAPALARCSRRDRAAADHLSQPDPVDPADLLRGRRAGELAGADLLPRQVRRPDRQRPEPGDRLDPGHRRRHRLCPACSSRDIEKSSVVTRTGTRRWRSRCTAPPRPSSPAPAP